jgi:hypothetical protein
MNCAKIGDSVSSTHFTQVGTPHGTLAGSNDSELIINNQQLDPGFIKSVDEGTS